MQVMQGSMQGDGSSMQGDGSSAFLTNFFI